MKRSIPFVLTASSAAAILIAARLFVSGADAQETSSAAPQFTKDNRLIRPTDFREWIYVSSGLGMTYGPAAARAEGAPMFDNVFVAPAAYRSFIKTGKWPDKTIFILEVRSATSHGSINNGGHFQTGVLAVEAAVKDETRFPDKWAYFSFDSPANAKSAGAFTKAECFDCHHKNAAVENTFTQFYPTLMEVATKSGTVNPGYKPNPSKD